MAGLSFGIGNVVFGINISQKGVYGGGFPGPAALLLAAIFKFTQQIKVKRSSGHWVDKQNSNYYKPLSQ